MEETTHTRDSGEPIPFTAAQNVILLNMQAKQFSAAISSRPHLGDVLALAFLQSCRAAARLA